MGTAGTALFADDFACDVRDEFLDYLRSGCDPVETTHEMVRNYTQEIGDMDAGPVFWLALAATQWKYGCLGEDVRTEAVRVIDDRLDIVRWTGPAAVRRGKVLAALREQLHLPQEKFRRPRQRPPIEIPTLQMPSPDGTACAVAYALGKSTRPGAPKMQVYLNTESNGSHGGGHVVLADCEYDEISLDWVDADTLRIGYPASAVLTNACATSYFAGRVINIVYDPNGR